MSFDSQPFGKNGKPKADILTRLSAIKPNHGNYRKAQDAIAEITKQRQDNAFLREENRRLQAKLDAIQQERRLVA
jgi:hypothetical protein